MMKKLMKKISRKDCIRTFIMTMLIFVVSSQSAYAVSFHNEGAVPIKIDGYFDDWQDKPHSWEYNWNNPNDYWENGIHVFAVDSNGDKYNDVVRHKMSLFSDGKYVYLYVKMAKNWYKSLNGNDYQFWIDNQMVGFRLVTLNGGNIDEGSLTPGINKIRVVHERSAWSGKNAQGSRAYVYRQPDSVNDQLELRIPLKTFKKQNPNIDIEHFKQVSFFTPNLMYRKISATTTSTYPYFLILVGLAICIYGAFRYGKKGIER